MVIALHDVRLKHEDFHFKSRVISLDELHRLQRQKTKAETVEIGSAMEVESGSRLENAGVSGANDRVERSEKSRNMRGGRLARERYERVERLVSERSGRAEKSTREKYDRSENKTKEKSERFEKQPRNRNGKHEYGRHDVVSCFVVSTKDYGRRSRVYHYVALSFKSTLPVYFFPA